MAEATVKLHMPDGQTVEKQALVGATLLSVCPTDGAHVAALCGGSGRCKKCRVRADGKLSPRAAEEADLPQEERLACLARIAGDCEVWLNAASEMLVETDGTQTARAFAPMCAHGLGAAIDIGTTTVVAYLYDLATGTRLAALGEENHQRRYGADVISRITYTMEVSDGLAALCQAIRQQLTALLQRTAAAANRCVSEITAVCVAGNTVMAHLFAGLSPAGLAKLPFSPVSLFDKAFSADPAWLGLSETAILRILPAVSAFVGGDITAAALAVGLDNTQAPTILLDIGTNGEMALAANGNILCCATAAGPAFEGADITCGMSGTEGAIDTVSWEDGKLCYTVIGDEAPKGLCGSGLIDLLAVLLQIGAVDETGRLLAPDEAPDEALPYLRETDEGAVIFVISETVYLTERDVRRLQLAKAAIAGGIATLLDEAGLAADAVETVCIAGGFGAHLHPQSAGAIGLYPSVWSSRAKAVGNAAGMGASTVLCSQEGEEALWRLAETMQTLELSADPRFTEFYVENMMF